MRLRRGFAVLHRWLGLAVAVPLLLLVITGALLVYKDSLFVPASWSREDVPLPRADMQLELERLLSDVSLEGISAVQIARGVRAFHTADWPDGSRQFLPLGGGRPAAPWSLELEHGVFELHRALLLVGAGEVVIDWVGPTALAMTLLGAGLWWPVRRGWRRRDLWPRTVARPPLLRAHVALGAVLFATTFVQFGTGALMAHNPTLRQWLRVWVPSQPVREWPQFARGDVRAAVEAIFQVFPDGVVTQLAPTGATGAQRWSVKLRLPGERHVNGRSFVALDIAAGRVTAATDARLTGAPGVYDDWVYPLHIAQVGSGWVAALLALVWALSALGSAALISFGVTAWLRR